MLFRNIWCQAHPVVFGNRKHITKISCLGIQGPSYTDPSLCSSYCFCTTIHSRQLAWLASPKTCLSLSHFCLFIIKALLPFPHFIWKGARKAGSKLYLLLYKISLPFLNATESRSTLSKLFYHFVLIFKVLSPDVMGITSLYSPIIGDTYFFRKFPKRTSTQRMPSILGLHWASLVRAH